MRTVENTEPWTSQLNDLMAVLQKTIHSTYSDSLQTGCDPFSSANRNGDNNAYLLFCHPCFGT